MPVLSTINVSYFFLKLVITVIHTTIIIKLITIINVKMFFIFICLIQLSDLDPVYYIIPQLIIALIKVLLIMHAAY